MGRITRSETPLSFEEILEIIKTAKEENIDVSLNCKCLVVKCNCDCNGNGGGNDNGPSDPQDPNEGEPLSLYVTPDCTSIRAAQAIADCNELILSWYAEDVYSTNYTPQFATGTPKWDRYWGTRSKSEGTVEYYFKRRQYITGYEMGTINAYSPQIWNLYLSSDGGETWQLADSQDFDLTTVTTKAWTIEEPGFYDAYKLEVLSTSNNMRIALYSMRMQGLPTEVIPANMEIVSRYGVTISGNQVTNPLNATNVTKNGNYAQFLVNGYIDYAFDAVRQARSFGIVTQNNTLTGWEILGSSDGQNWESLCTASDQVLTPLTEVIYEFPKTALYQYYRFVATQLTGSAGYLNYFQLYR